MNDQSLIVAGVDTHKDTHYAAVISATGAHLGAAQFPATVSGHAKLPIGGHGTCPLTASGTARWWP